MFVFKRTDQIANKMRKEAENNTKKYFPGKEIKKLKPNFDEKKFLRNLKSDYYPMELKQYLDGIKSFFET